jgi:5-methylcytosine-specific restriction protein A
MTLRRQCLIGGRSCSDGGVAVPGASRCRKHLGASGWARYMARFPERAQFYRSGGWRAARERQLRMEPNCRVCGQKAVVADHIRNRAVGGADLDVENLQSLCQRCHDEKTTREGHRGMKRKAERRKSGE